MKFAGFASLFFLLVTIVSCQKEHSNESPQQEEYASKISTESDAESQVVFNDVFDNVIGVDDVVGIGGVGVFAKSAVSVAGSSFRTDTTRCFTVTTTQPSTTNFPITITIDFGAGCLGRDGHYRSGKIITTYTNRLIFPGAKATTTFDNFYFDSIKVEGVHEISNIGTLTELKLKVVVENAKLTKPNGNYIEWNSRRTITRIEGNLTPLPLDDIFKIEGESSGKVKRGNVIAAWSTEIIEPLIKKFSCRWIIKGAIRITRPNLGNNSPWVAILDYGNGICDNKAVIIINGVAFEISLV